VPGGQTNADEANPPAGEAKPVGAEPKPPAALDLSTPRATMRAFLLAMQDASGAKPERINDALSCLDISWLKGEDRAERARSLARRLYTILETQTVRLDDVPERADQHEGYLFFQLEPKPEVVPTPEIRLLRRRDSGNWVFTDFTLQSIPALEDALIKQAAKPAAESTVPAARRTPRATMVTFLDAMSARPPDLKSAVQCLDPTGRDAETWPVTARTLATQLKNVMDKIKLVVLTEIPDAPDAPPFVWYTSQTGNIVLTRIDEVPAAFAAELKPGEWRFTRKTLDTLAALYDEYEGRPIVAELRAQGVQEHLTWGLWVRGHMPAQLRQTLLGLEGWKWLTLALLVGVGWLIGRFAAWLAGQGMTTWLRRRRIAIDPAVQRRGLRSTGWLASVFVWYYGVQLLGLPEVALRIALPTGKFVLAIMAVGCGYRIVDVIGGYIARTKEIRLSRFDEMLVPLLRTLLRLAVVLVVILFVLNYGFNQPPSVVVGALGIGGVALAFAAKETLGNFFGSLTVLFDRPFGVGDWINVNNVDGTVEHVGFRSTRIRTFYNSLITIPNAKMVDSLVDNYGARRYRRAKTTLSILYSTPPERIDAFCEGIRELVRLHPYTRKDYYHVYFHDFGASSLDIMLYVFFEVSDYGIELRERHNLFLDILRLAERLGVEFAFPTQTVWLNQAPAAADAQRPSPSASAPVPQSAGPRR